MGQKFAAYDSAGAVVAFYDSIDSPVPDGIEAVEITEAQWQAAASTPGYTVVSGVLTAPAAPTASALLAAARSAQKAVIDAAYAVAIQQPVSFTTAAGVTELFQADVDSQDILKTVEQGYAILGSTPAGFYWVAAGNAKVAFTLPDLQGLYGAMLERGWAAFQTRQNLKAEIDAATTIFSVQAVVWPSTSTSVSA
ncbi:DUF4376 domain-containing protein [Burkholderia cepacia]|uniref:DUF4376 domain-containing protein n=1 Tax=Burkholderia cepacia TaxID=292 RepID=UPI0007591C24|nr:DUF4376 domain-containing protein [Burkholderia cepacia]KWF81318.1 hypothetical protein WL94_28535 [Burkholderia cepacia]MDN7441213.1 DUF4376 domain-containing protein [Burkholderia cepacia]